MLRRLCFSTLMVLIAGFCFAADPAVPEDPTERMSYSLGYQVGGDLAEQKPEVDGESFLLGVRDGLSGGEPRLSREEMEGILVGIKRKIHTKELAARETRKQEMKKTREEYHKADEEFLAVNAQREGIVVLPSGVQYEVLTEGTGKMPGIQDAVMINYRGTKVDGKEFGSSYHKGEPQEFKVSAVIPGLAEALLLMKEGAKWNVFIPAEHAFSTRSPLAERAVVYEVELVSVINAK